MQLFAILEHRSMQMNKTLTEKAQNSADRMELITKEMYDIAEKTKRETVSMRIITLVTLYVS